jgi:TRAP-type C4-dicarboxylate transport system permease small subunit
MKVFDRAISWLESAFETVTVILMLAIMVIVFTDVVSRYILNSPLTWAFDLIGLYLMAGVFFLSLSKTYAVNGHVGVDILLQRASPKWRRFAEIVTCAFSIPLFGLMAFVGAQRAYVSWINDETLSGLIAWPTWLSAALVPIGASLLVLRLIFALAGHVMSLLCGRDVIPLEPLAGHGEG